MLAPSTQFCHNAECSARGKVGEGNIVIHSKKERRYRCNVCGDTFIQAVVAAFGLDERTVADWQARLVSIADGSTSTLFSRGT